MNCKKCGIGEEGYLYFVNAKGDFAPLGWGATAMVCHDCYYNSGITCLLCPSDINWCDCVYHLDGIQLKSYYLYIEMERKKVSA